MRDMFYNYDNNIDKKECPIPIMQEDRTKILESNPNLSLVTDVFGNELGICARHRIPFELFFMMDGCVENSSIEKLICNGTISFQIYDYWHKVILTKDINGLNCYIGDDTIRIELTQDDVNKFNQETYYMNLAINWPGGSYVLYSQDNGFLTIK